MPYAAHITRIERNMRRAEPPVWDHIAPNQATSFSPEQGKNDKPANDMFPAGERFLEFQKWFLNMRWIACVVAADLIIVTVVVLKYLDAETLKPLLALVGCIAAANIAYSVCLRKGWYVHRLAEVGIYIDLAILTLMLHFSGGIENPLSFVYVFHVIIAGILLSRPKCFTVVVVASVLYAAMASAEMDGLVRHYTLAFFPHPHVEGDELFHAAHQPLFVGSLVGLHVMLMSFTAYFTTTIMTRLHQEENRAVAARQRLDRVVQAAGAGLAVLDKGLRVVWLNDQMRHWSSVSGAGTSDSVGRVETWVGGEDGPAVQSFRDGKTHVEERQVVDAAGGKRFFEITVAPLVDDNGDVYQVVALAQEITRRKIVEAEMMHSAKMASLGLISAGLAHEIGNPLASISTRLRLLEDEHDELFLKDSIRLLQGQIIRIDRIVHGVSQFAKPVGHEWTMCNVSAIVAETVEVLRLHNVAKSCRIDKELDETIPKTMGARDQLIQVFMNLGLNALETVPKGGALTVRTYRSRGGIRIEFADTGEGMDEQTRSRLFMPFFSTKDDGLGLGLYIAQNLVHAHGGQIEVESSPGSGSVFTVVLPIRPPGESSSGRVEREQR